MFKTNPTDRRDRRGRAVLGIALSIGFLIPFPADRGPVVRRNCLALLFIDLEVLACGACAGPLDELVRALPASLQIERVRGILVYRDPDSGGAAGRRGRIARVQWSGFARGHAIQFPVAFDDGHVFREAAGPGLSACLFDFDEGTVKKSTAPLRRPDVDAIADFLSR